MCSRTRTPKDLCFFKLTNTDYSALPLQILVQVTTYIIGLTTCFYYTYSVIGEFNFTVFTQKRKLFHSIRQKRNTHFEQWKYTFVTYKQSMSAKMYNPHETYARCL